MQRGHIRVKVGPGMFRSERSVSFQVGDQAYNLFVDQSDVQNNLLSVYVVERNGDEAIIDLPRDTFTTGNRIRIPSSYLICP